MNTKILIAIIVTVIVAGSGGYMIGKSSTDTDTTSQGQQASITMMREQAESIKQMSTMMQSSGRTMQELGTQYNDDMMMSKGKDLEMFGQKYMREESEATQSNDSMKKMMGN